MIKIRPWRQLPSEPVRRVLPELLWSTADGRKPAAEIAALMVYVALNFMAETWWNEKQFHSLAEGSYRDLQDATGLSRALISAALGRLIELGLVEPEGSHQKRRYVITYESKASFFKLPCKAIVTGSVIVPFRNFTLRSKHELHALKLYLYYAAIRNNSSLFSMAAYETINAKTGIREADIRKANGVLMNSGLLLSVDRDHQGMVTKNEPNKYYLTGYESLLRAEAPDSRTVMVPVDDEL